MKKVILLLLVFLFLVGCKSQAENRVLTIALLDTGISASAIKSENIIEGWNYVQNNSDTEDRINHGTAVASVILGSESAKVEGLAEHARVVPLVVADKVDGKETAISPDELAKAIRDSVDKYDACIINVSLGITTHSDKLQKAIEYVQKKGALVIGAAGNSGDNELYYPAAYDGVLAVGSHDKDLKISSFTQHNDTVDILAPGEDIWLASRRGKTYGARGTSYATSYVSAAAFIIWENNPDSNAEDIKEKLFETTTTVDGWKILNIS